MAQYNTSVFKSINIKIYSLKFENFSFPIKDNLNLPDLNFFQVDRLFVYDHFSQVLRYIISDKTGRNADCISGT